MFRDAQTELTIILENCTDIIGYTPIFKEPDYTTAPPLRFFKGTFHIIPPEPHNNPFACAEYFHAQLQNKQVPLLIPGQSFDCYGTRHGRGGGWYDRFLSRVPREWLRIGIASQANYFDKKLYRNSWDELMDYIFIYDSSDSSWAFHRVQIQH